MRKWLIALIIGIVLVQTKPINAEETYDWDFLNKISNTALQLAKQERYSESAQLLDYFSMKFEDIPINRDSISLDHFRMISSTHKDAKSIIQDEKKTKEEKVRTLTKFRLVVDAMVSEHQPLWGSMESTIMETFSQIMTDVQAGDIQSFQHDWNEFLSLYEIIYPSIQVDIDDRRVKQMDEHISVIGDKFFQDVPETSRVKQLLLMEEELKAIFERVKEDEADPSLVWVMITTGSIILLSLSYSGWRKYRGEKEKLEKREQNKE